MKKGAARRWSRLFSVKRRDELEFAGVILKGDGELLEAELEACLDGAEGDACVGGDLALAHALVEGELDGLLLGLGQRLEKGAQGLADIGHDEVLLGIGGPGVGLAFDLVAEAVFSAAVALALAQAVDGPTAGER